MGPIGHFSVGLAAKNTAPKVPLGIPAPSHVDSGYSCHCFAFAGIEGRGSIGLPWSHGLFMSFIWSAVAALLSTCIYRDRRAAVVVGLLVFSHWMLDFVSHPIPFYGFSWHSWQWTFGHPLPSDLPLLFGDSRKVDRIRIFAQFETKITFFLNDFGERVPWIPEAIKNRHKVYPGSIKIGNCLHPESHGGGY